MPRTKTNNQNLLDNSFPNPPKNKRAAFLTEVTPDPDGSVEKSLKMDITLSRLDPIDTHNAAEVRDRIDLYLNTVTENHLKPTFAGLALALGVDRPTAVRWASGVGNEKEVCDALKKARILISSQFESWMQNGNINPVSGIFLMKNNLAYRDQTEVEIAVQNPFGDLPQKGELEQKYLDAIPAEFEDVTDR